MTGSAMTGPRVVARGLAALAGLAVLVAGVPAVLWATGGTPVPSGWPALGDIRDAALRPDDGTLFLGLLVAAGWIGWATFVLSLLVEVPATLCDRVAPRLPGLGAQQRLVAGLVAAVAAVGPGAQVASAGSAPYGPWEPAPPVTTDLLEQQRPADEPGVDESGVDEPGAGEPDAGGLGAGEAEATIHVVVDGDTLWDIAGARLGAASRYPEIFTASAATVQPDGRRLTDPDQILPGWTLTVPAAAEPPAVLPDTGLPDTGRPVGESRATVGDKVPPAGELTGEHLGEAVVDAGPVCLGSAEAGATGTGVAGADLTGIDVTGTGVTGADEAESGDDSGGIVRTAGGVGAVLAAALASVLAARRARQQRRRRPGQRLATGTAADRAAETELRQAADPAGVAFVDRALRTLAGRLAESGRGLPPLRAARLTGRSLELYLAAPAELPHPFVGTAHGGVWTVAVGADGVLGDDRTAGVPAPYPSLVTLGHDSDDALVLLDLEQLGTLVVDGPPEVVRSALTAIAAELATSRWADDLRVTLVGGTAWAGIDLLETGRVRHVTDVDALLDEITIRVADDRLLLATAGVSGLGAARVAQVADAAWTPEILVVAEPLPADQWRRLDALMVTAPRVAVAAVVGGLGLRDRGPVDHGSGGHRVSRGLRADGGHRVSRGHGASGGSWVLRIHGSPDEPAAMLEPLGVAVRPQLLDGEARRRFLELLRAAESDPAGPPGDLAPAPSAVPAASEPAASRPGGTRPVGTGPPSRPEPLAAPPAVVESVPRVRPGRALPRLIMLGPVEVTHAAELGEQTKLGQLTELAMFIALNPGCDSTAIDHAVWPGSAVTKTTRGTAISKLRRWLGTDATGASLLPRTESGYTFLPGIRSDWQDWCDLLPEGPARATTADLRAALELVHGRPFSGRGRRRYAWVDHLAQEMIASIVDGCHELALRALVDRDPWEALRTALLGLSVEPGVEVLWRDRLKAEIALGDRATVLESIGKLRVTADELGGDLEPETEELIEQIVSGSRLTTAGPAPAGGIRFDA